MIIDITKKYTTRSGMPVRIYAVDGAGHYQVHGATQQPDGWLHQAWAVDGTYNRLEEDPGMDLIPVKTWRAWRQAECPKRLIARNKRTFQICALNTGSHSDLHLSDLFKEWEWLHEDGSETPCGVGIP